MTMGFLDGYKTYDTRHGHGNPKEWRETFYKRMSSEEAEEILSRHKEQSPWDILGVKNTDTLEVIKKAFRALVMYWHPDRNHSKEAETMTKKIVAAYTKITGG